MVLYETKAEVLDDSFVNSIWGRRNRDWRFLGSSGWPGGLVCVWDNSSLSLEVCAVVPESGASQ